MYDAHSVFTVYKNNEHKVEHAQEEHGDDVLVYVGSYLKAVSTEQLVNRASWLWCVCLCVCRRVPRVVARCRSAGHVALI